MPNVPVGIFRALAARQGGPRPDHSQTGSQGMALAWKRSWSSRSGVAARAVDAPDLNWNPTFGSSLEFSSRSLPRSVLGELLLVNVKAPPTVFQVRLLIASRQYGQVPERSKRRLLAASTC